VGAALVARGVSGRCPVYGTMGTGSADGERPWRGRLPGVAEGGVSVNASIIVDRAPDEAYALWRDFSNAPRFMEHVAGVEVLDETRSRWTATGPMGRSWSWENEVVEDRPGELIAWESLPGADLPNRGWVQFVPAGDGNQTEVRHFLELDPPEGVIAQAIASVFHAAPRDTIRADLRRFRTLLEAGEASPVAE
jgi:uncharacterized membrane protein